MPENMIMDSEIINCSEKSMTTDFLTWVKKDLDIFLVHNVINTPNENNNRGNSMSKIECNECSITPTIPPMIATEIMIKIMVENSSDKVK